MMLVLNTQLSALRLADAEVFQTNMLAILTPEHAARARVDPMYFEQQNYKIASHKYFNPKNETMTGLTKEYLMKLTNNFSGASIQQTQLFSALFEADLVIGYNNLDYDLVALSDTLNNICRRGSLPSFTSSVFRALPVTNKLRTNKESAFTNFFVNTNETDSLESKISVKPKHYVDVYHIVKAVYGPIMTDIGLPDLKLHTVYEHVFKKPLNVQNAKNVLLATAQLLKHFQQNHALFPEGLTFSSFVYDYKRLPFYPIPKAEFNTHIVRYGKYAGKTISDIVASGSDGVEWLKQAERSKKIVFETKPY